jgi:hypothetical protein
MKSGRLPAQLVPYCEDDGKTELRVTFIRCNDCFGLKKSRRTVIFRNGKSDFTRRIQIAVRYAGVTLRFFSIATGVCLRRDEVSNPY